MPPEDLQTLARLGVATIYEAAGRRGLIDIPLIQLTPHSRVAGLARTVLCAQGDNLMVHAAMAVAKPGEVLVIAMPQPEPVALVGELLATQAKAHGVVGLLVNAAVRDAEELATLGVPVWARYIRARGAERKTPGRLGVALKVGGTLVRNGDIIVLDADGAVAIPIEQAPAVLQAALERARREENLREEYRQGVLSIDRYGLRGLVEEELRP